MQKLLEEQPIQKTIEAIMWPFKRKSKPQRCLYFLRDAAFCGDIPQAFEGIIIESIDEYYKINDINEWTSSTLIPKYRVKILE